jgi:hypothetical protein
MLMPITQQQYTDVVYRASRANAVLTQTLRTQEGLGYYPDWSIVSCQSLKIKSGKWSLLIGDYTSEASVDIYNQLLTIGASWSGGIVLDPNAQTPGTTIVTVPVLQNLNDDKIPFTTTSGSPQLILSNYNTLYAPLYGNNPIVRPYIYSGGFADGDEQTAPQITYATPGDPTSAITQILWDYPVATSGYVQITGIGTSGESGPPAGGTGGSYEVTYHESDLLYDADFGYYLPLILASNRRPVFVEVNNDQIATTYIRSVTPGQLRGFANNDTQTIVVTIL